MLPTSPCTKEWCLPATGRCVWAVFRCCLPCGSRCAWLLRLAGKPTGRGGGDVELDVQGTLPLRAPQPPKREGSGKGREAEAEAEVGAELCARDKFN